MTRQQIILRSPSEDRQEPLLENSGNMSRDLRREHPLLVDKSEYYPSRASSRRARLAEVAGGTTAECAAVACCCPCGLVNLLVLAAFKVPAGLCKKAMRRRRRHRLEKSGLLSQRKCHCSDCDMEILPITNPEDMVNALESDNSEVIELEKEMWDRFYSTGFWRSPSQRTDISAQSQ